MNNIIEIDMENVKRNIEMSSKSRKACLMVKANCYGVGNEALSKLIEMGYDFFGVSTLEEALEVRKLSEKVEILIVSYTSKDDLNIIKENNLQITIYDFDMLKSIDKDIYFHLKFDTNMGRLGFKTENIDEIKHILDEKKFVPLGIYTHLACASDEDKTLKVIEKFKEISNNFSKYDIKYIHYANSVASINYETSFDNMVRLGIGMWGYSANKEESNLLKEKFHPAITIKVRISNIKKYEGPISYDHSEDINGIVYTLSGGYRDGFDRRFQGYEVNGIGRVVGKINMCQQMLLVDEKNDKYKKGDIIEYVKKEEIYELCSFANITVYELLTGLSERFERVLK